jgi:hypothetical protein
MIKMMLAASMNSSCLEVSLPYTELLHAAL